MNQWKQVISRLSTTGKVMARWHLTSGGAPYMYVPPEESLTEEKVDIESGVYFSEIVALEIKAKTKLGGLLVANDIDGCRAALASMQGVLIKRLEDGIRVELA